MPSSSAGQLLAAALDAVNPVLPDGVVVKIGSWVQETLPADAPAIYLWVDYSGATTADRQPIEATDLWLSARLMSAILSPVSAAESHLDIVESVIWVLTHTALPNVARRPLLAEITDGRSTAPAARLVTEISYAISLGIGRPAGAAPDPLAGDGITVTQVGSRTVVQ